MSATATVDRPARETVRERPRRDPLFDNAKLILVTLVVVGHGWALLPVTTTTAWAYNFLYLWHVPAFVLVTGYLSRSFRCTRRDLTRLLTTVAVPYVVFEGLLAAFRTGVGGEHLTSPLWIDPHWPMWYLSALFLWRLMAPLFRRLPVALPVAVVVSLAGGLTAGHVLDVERVMALLPFFVLGLRARREHVEWLRRPAVQAAAVGVLTLALAWAPFIENTLGREWLYWRSGYDELGVGVWHGIGLRAMHLLVSGVLSLAVFALIPHGGRWFTRLGAASLVVYLCHGFFVKTAYYGGFSDWADAHPRTALLLVPFGAVPVALLLAWPPVARRLTVVVDPVGTWRRRRAARDAPAGSGRDVGAPDARTAVESTLSEWRTSSHLGSPPR